MCASEWEEKSGWGFWDPLSQTQTDLSNQTRIEGQGGRAEGRRVRQESCVHVSFFPPFCILAASMYDTD